MSLSLIRKNNTRWQQWICKKTKQSLVAKTKELHSNSSIYFCNSLFISFWRIYYNPHQFYLLHLSMLFHWTLVTFYFYIDSTEFIVMLLWDCHHCSFIYTGVCTPLYPCRYFLHYVDIKHLIDNFFFIGYRFYRTWCG